MRIPRVHVEAPIAGRDRVTLGERAAHHVQRVLRLRPGDALILFDGEGGEYHGRVMMADGRVGAEIEGFAPADRTTAPAITLWQAVCRGGRMDHIVEKATELGVRRIVPVLTRRVVVRLEGSRGEQRAAHWQKVAISACEQCGSNRVPRVAHPLSLDDAMSSAQLQQGARIWLDPEADLPLATLGECPAEVTLLVGPEGGFEGAEIERLRAAAWQPAALGPRILRADTAGIAATCILNALHERQQGSPHD